MVSEISVVRRLFDVGQVLERCCIGSRCGRMLIGRAESNEAMIIERLSGMDERDDDKVDLYLLS